jgi:hypothetical protein
MSVILPRSHSHNDYEQLWPLSAALHNGFISVEADIWSVDNELLIGHDKEDLASEVTLRKLYLAPLATRVAQYGQVLSGLTEPFQLLIEIKDDPAITFPLLDTQLREYAEILTRYEHDLVTPGAISVVITGHYSREVLAAQPVRFAACDGHLSDIGTGIAVSLMPLCSDNWRWHFSWLGIGRMPKAQRAKLAQLVQAAHNDGRKVRFWGAPKWPPFARNAAWTELAEAGVDYLGADNLVAFRRWARKHTKLQTPLDI